MSGDFSISEFRERISQEFEVLLTTGVLEVAEPEIQKLLEIAREYPARGGKIIRGRLAYFSCRAYGVSDTLALRLAAAVETLHNWALIHDDIEDGSPVRRGQPALHRQYGIPLALNASDFLLMKLWIYLQGIDGQVSFGIAQRIREEFMSLILQMIQGQHYELSWIHEGDFRGLGRNRYFEMTALKTARYSFTGPLRLGALAAGVPPPPEFHEAGKNLGIAFQIRDDISDFWANPPEENKTNETWDGGVTFPLILLLEDCPDEDYPALSRIIRGEAAGGDFDRIKVLFEEKDILGKCQEQAESFLDEGRRTLEPAFSRVLVSKWADLIRELVRELS